MSAISWSVSASNESRWPPTSLPPSWIEASRSLFSPVRNTSVFLTREAEFCVEPACRTFLFPHLVSSIVLLLPSGMKLFVFVVLVRTRQFGSRTELRHRTSPACSWMSFVFLRREFRLVSCIHTAESDQKTEPPAASGFPRFDPRRPGRLRDVTVGCEAWAWKVLASSVRSSDDLHTLFHVCKTPRPGDTAHSTTRPEEQRGGDTIITTFWRLFRLKVLLHVKF